MRPINDINDIDSLVDNVLKSVGDEHLIAGAMAEADEIEAERNAVLAQIAEEARTEAEAEQNEILAQIAEEVSIEALEEQHKALSGQILVQDAMLSQLRELALFISRLPLLSHAPIPALPLKRTRADLDEMPNEANSTPKRAPQNITTAMPALKIDRNNILVEQKTIETEAFLEQLNHYAINLMLIKLLSPLFSELKKTPKDDTKALKQFRVKIEAVLKKLMESLNKIENISRSISNARDFLTGIIYGPLSFREGGAVAEMQLAQIIHKNADLLEKNINSIITYIHLNNEPRSVLRPLTP